ncbi:MAG: hypothetical protein IJU23_07475 [Proteobacteria bacterium]|nr:hypothetical protein [Pseudomonadota bacterium]
MSQELKKVMIVETEGDGTTVETMFNPKELSFTKSVNWSDDNVGQGTNFPALAFTAGQAITVSIELFFDCYEKSDQDVRPEVKKCVHLCEIQDCKGEKRPPIVQLVWADSDPIGVGNFTGVVESAQVKYTMFTTTGVPCRASVTVSIKQATEVHDAQHSNKGSQKPLNNAAEVSNTPGAQEQLIENGTDPVSCSYPQTYTA